MVDERSETVAAAGVAAEAAPAPAPRMAAEESALWARWREAQDAAARNALFERHASWSRLVARDVFVRLRVRSADWSDYVQYASIGLLEAISRYDPARGVDFQTYARHRVRGAVFNGMREFLDRGPRAGAQEARYAERAASFAEREDGERDDPMVELVGATLGLAMGFLLDLDSLPHQPAENDAYRSVERLEVQTRVTAAVARLPDRERTIITLHYLQHVQFQDIAEMLGVTKGRISQMHKRALERMRAEFEGEGPS